MLLESAGICKEKRIRLKNIVTLVERKKTFPLMYQFFFIILLKTYNSTSWWNYEISKCRMYVFDY